MKRKRRGNYKRGRPPLGTLHYAAIELLSAWGSDRLTLEQTATVLNVNRRTIYRWRKRPDFDRELQRAINRKLQRHRPKRKDYAMQAAVNGDIAFVERFFNAWMA